MKAKLFLKFFLTSLVIFILVLVPIVKAVSDVNLFSEDTDGDGIGASADSAGVFTVEGDVNIIFATFEAVLMRISVDK